MRTFPLMSIMSFFFSLNALAACPTGMQGSANFNEAAGILKRMLGENLSTNCVADETQPGTTRVRLILSAKSGNLFVSLLGSSDGKKFDEVKVSPTLAEVCSGGGQVTAVVGGHEIPIARTGSGIKVTMTYYGEYSFRALQPAKAEADAVP